MKLFSRQPVYRYPTSSTYMSNLCLAVALCLTGVGLAIHLARAPFPIPLLIAPAALAYLAAWVLGPGMQEEFFVDEAQGSLWRRVRTLGVGREEEVFPSEMIRLVGTARIRDVSADRVHGAYLVVLDQRGRWLVLTHYHSLAQARQHRDVLASSLGKPGVDYRCSSDWVPYWGRVQPPPPPETAALPPGAALEVDE